MILVKIGNYLIPIVVLSIIVYAIKKKVSIYDSFTSGAKEGLMLIRNADKVASLCNDVIGDVCGILSGAAGASIVARITVDFQNANLSILVASLITAFIAGVTIFGKALGKHTAMDNCNSIILRVGKILSLFTKQNKTKKVKDKKDKNLDEKPNE